MRARLSGGVVFAALGAMLSGCLSTRASGVVFADHNGDGIRQPGEPGVASAVVALDRGTFVRTDGEGRYTIDSLADDGLLWVRVPSGFRPGAVYRRISTAANYDLPVVPLSEAEAAAPLEFVVAADSHVTTSTTSVWDGGDLDETFRQLVDTPAPLRFVTIVGDMTQGNAPEEFARLNATLAKISVPWVPVPGNHDWYDGGATYRATYGVDNYSFEIDDVHFIVWDTNLSEEAQLEFFARDLQTVMPSTVVVAFGHASPSAAVATELQRLGVDYLFTGHWHANRRVDRGGGLTEWSTQTLVMGGIDGSPAGYRLVRLDGGVPTIEHRERLVQPQLDAVFPRSGTCAPAAGFEVAAAAALGATTPTVTARIDCGAPVALAHRGGWHHAGTIPALSPGAHALTLTATTPGGTLMKTLAFEVCDETAPAAPVTGSWPQLGGSATHTNAVPSAIAPPMRTAWRTALGGIPAFGGVVVDGTTAVVAIADRGRGDAGGLVAVDITTGALRWRAQTDGPVVNAPAIGGGLVVAATSDARVVAFDLATGEPQWDTDLAGSLDPLNTSLWAAPTIDGDLVYIGIQGNVAALRLATGMHVWSMEPHPGYPWLGSRAAAAVADGRALFALNRDLGLLALDTLGGQRIWTNTSGTTTAINSTPVIADDVAYVTNSYGDAAAVAVASGAVRWSRRLTPEGFDWAYTIMATPAYANGRLFVPTQWDDLVALDGATGRELWRAQTGASALNVAHYRSHTPSFMASPLVTGDFVWAGRPDGKLVALAADTGAELWTTDLGAPIMTTPAPAGDHLLVATYDGTLQALVPGTPRPALPEPAACPPLEPSPEGAPLDPAAPQTQGCGCSGGTDDVGAGLLLLALLTASRTRSRRAGR